jgi:16S rRNA (guanine527-N7)-methyltransferase
MTEMNGSLTEGLKELNIEYNDEKLEKIATFYEMIIEKNKVMNLTRITYRQDFITKH